MEYIHKITDNAIPSTLTIYLAVAYEMHKPYPKELVAVSSIVKSAITSSLLAFLGLSFSCRATPTTVVPAGYSLVWSDEFEKPGLPDEARWGYDTWANSKFWWHNERQFYTARRQENARVSDGMLTIETRKEELRGQKDWVGQEYSSTRLKTLGKKSWRYGFFDIRAKLPCGRGVWPAFWLLSDTGKWPADGEIDIMEQVGQEPGQIHSTLHSSSEANRVTAATAVPDSCDNFHNYQMDWRKDSITFLVDGKVTLRAEKGSKSYAQWPYDHGFYLLLNTAVGGAWGGQKGIDDNVFPVKLDIDYVRVYQPN